jgi:hypothetical protein
LRPPPLPPLSPRGDEEAGGWSGWEEPPPPEEQSEHHDEARDDALFEPFVRAAVEEEEQKPRTHSELAEGEREDEATERREVEMEAVDEQEEGEVEPTASEETEETEAELLARLGLKLDEGLKGLGNQMTQQTFTRWVALEEARDREQWAPLRPRAVGGSDDEEAAAALEREIHFDDVRDGLFSLPSTALRCAAAARCLALLRVPSTGSYLPAWASAHPFLRSCVLSWAETPVAAASLETLFAHPPPVPAWLAPDASAVASTAATPTGAPEALWAHGTTQRYQFVQTLLTALLTAFPSHAPFLDALLAHALRHPAAETSTPSCSAHLTDSAVAATAPTTTVAAAAAPRYHALPGTPLNPQPPCAAASSAAVAAVKATLAAHQGQPTLWTAYAWTEALKGRLASARRVLDTVLAAVPTLSVAARRQAPVAWLAYAELELSVDNEDASGRAIHLLCGLAEGGPFAPPPPPLKRTKSAAAYKSRIDDAVDRSIDSPRLQTCRAALQALLEAELRDAGGAPPRTERGVAVVAAAALFAFLTVGVDAADAVYAQVSLLFPVVFKA